MPRFKPTNTSQGQFIVVNLNEQLLTGTFEWTVNQVINKMNMSIFEQNYHNDEKGATAYSPRVLLKAILYCYSKGIISSRQIEETCKNNMVAKALAGDFEPDHDTIATFVSINGKAVADLFSQVLLVCSEFNLITGEMFAVDGCKLSSNASKEWSGKIEDINKKKEDLERLLIKILHQHRELDKSEEAKKIQKPFSKTMGDDEERRRRHVRRIEDEIKKLDMFLSKAEPKTGPSGQEVQTNITDPESARIKGPHGYIQGYNGIAVADAANQVIIAAQAIGSGAESGCFPEMLDTLEENMKTITDKEHPLKKSIVLGDSGYSSENNLQEAEKRDIEVLIPDSQFRKRDPVFDDRKKYKETNVKKYFTIDDFEYNEKEDSFTCPAGKTLPYKCDVEFKSRGTRGKQYRQKKSVCSVCPLKEQCINRKKGKDEFRALFVPYREHEKNLSAEMREKIDNPAYREIYSRRMQIIEPVFANITFHKQMNRFTLRTQKKVNIQWLLFCMVHNIWKCMKPLREKYEK
jgi:transposase